VLVLEVSLSALSSVLWRAAVCAALLPALVLTVGSRGGTASASGGDIAVALDLPHPLQVTLEAKLALSLTA